MDTTLNSKQRNRLPTKNLPHLPDRVTPEQRYWNNLKYPIINKYPSSVNGIHFCSVDPYDFAVIAGTVVYIYDPLTNEVKKTISQFKQTVRCATFREDGQLLAAGGDDKKIQLFNVANKGILRQFRDHSGSIQDVQFLSGNGGTQIVSVSEDKTLRLFDIPTEKLVHTYLGHEDYVRCVRNSPVTSDVVATSSYDHTIKLWDIRSYECITTFEYENPVEKFEFFPSGTAIACAAGNGIVLRDIMTGKEISQLNNHQKTATSVRFDGTGTRLFSASLDHQVKIYDLDTYNVSHSIKYASPILDVGISKNNSHLVVGMSDGTVSIRRRESKKSEEERESSTFHSGTHRIIHSGSDDLSVPVRHREKISPYENLMRKFLYKEALDNVLANEDPQVVITVIEELIFRRSLIPCLAGRNKQELVPVLMFIQKFILNTRYNAHLFGVFECILDLYSPVLGRSPEVDEIILNIHLKLRAEVELQEQMFKLVGALEMVMTTTGLYNK